MAKEIITKEDAVRSALAEVGDVSAEDLVAFVQRRFSLRIEPKFVPLFKASIRCREQLEQARKSRGSPSVELAHVASAEGEQPDMAIEQ